MSTVATTYAGSTASKRRKHRAPTDRRRRALFITMVVVGALMALGAGLAGATIVLHG